MDLIYFKFYVEASAKYPMKTAPKPSYGVGYTLDEATRLADILSDNGEGFTFSFSVVKNRHTLRALEHGSLECAIISAHPMPQFGWGGTVDVQSVMRTKVAA